MLKLAICEDDVIQCEQIQCLTQSSLRIPFEFDIFSSAKGFLKQISNKKCPYQIVLMDIELGSESMSGINLAKKINSSNPNTQIIFISQHLNMPLLFMRQITFILFISNKWPNIFLKLFLLLAKKYTISVNNISVSAIIPGITVFFVLMFSIWNENCEIPRYIQNHKSITAAKKFRICLNN